MAEVVVDGRYHLQQEIGKGGMGTVYRAIDTYSGETIAVKALNANLTNDPQQVERFIREAEILRKLNHPNIVKVLDTVKTDDTYYIVMEYIKGGTLTDLLYEPGMIPIAQILQIALDLADALTRAHRLRIIHRDLKLANVLIADDGTPRLTDFGIALIPDVQRITDTNNIIGTVDYIAPEVLDGAEITFGADIWSLGVLLFMLVTGRHPFRRTSVAQAMHAILYNPVPDIETLRPDCPTPLVDLIYRMLEKNPSSRIASIRQVGVEIEKLLNSETIKFSVDIPSNTTSNTSRFQHITQVLTPVKHNIPAQTTPFVGRQNELDSLINLLNTPNTRLVTILAPGGMGKTRLALEVAHHFAEQLSSYSDTNHLITHGVYWVELAPLNDPDNIISTIAEAIGLRFRESELHPKQQLLDSLNKKSLMLVLDNCEHLIEDTTIINDILSSAPDVRILATSRQRLGQSSETLFTLGGMDFPEWTTLARALEYSAVQLFVQSAKRVRPDFELHAEDLDDVGRICRMLQGMPLGIVLAAAWLELLTLPEISDELEKSIDFLETEMTDIPERQRSLRAVFDYSWEHMPSEDQYAFMKLAVFRGDFTREAASTITGAGLRTLMNLVSKSVLRRDQQSGRFTLHEMLQQYALDKLFNSSDSEDLHNQYSAYFLNYLAKQEKALTGKHQISALNEIDSEWKHIAFAIKHALEQKNTALINLAITPLSMFISARKPVHEGFAIFNAIRQAYAPRRDETPSLIWAKASVRFNPEWFYDFQDHTLEKHLLTQTATLAKEANDNQEVVYCLSRLGYRAYWDGQLDEAITHLEDSIEIALQIGAESQLARALDRISECYTAQGNYNNARIARLDALQLAHRTGDLNTEASCLDSLAVDARLQGEYAKAEDYLEQALVVRNRLGDQVGIARTTLALAVYQFFRGQIERVRWDVAQVAQTLEDYLQEDVVIINALLAGIRFYLALLSEDYTEAEIVVTMRNSLLPNTTKAQASSHYPMMTIDLANNADHSAQEHLQRALTDALASHSFGTILECLPNAAILLQRQGETERAVELFALSKHLMGVYGHWLYQVPLYATFESITRQALSKEMYSRAVKIGQELELTSTVAELLARF